MNNKVKHVHVIDWNWNTDISYSYWVKFDEYNGANLFLETHKL